MNRAQLVRRAPFGGWLAIGGLTALAIAAIYFGNLFSVQGEITGALAGALIGGAGVILGGKLERAEARKTAELEQEARRAKLTTLIVAELVAVVVQYVTAYKFVAGAIDVMQRGVSAPPIEDLSRYAPSPLSWPRAFPSEILSLTERQLDILVTLGTNMALTRAAVNEVGTTSRPFNMLSAQGLRDNLAHDMGLLAEVFDEFAPARQLQFPGQSPELVS